MLIDIFVPTYKRPHELAKLAQNVRENTKNEYVLWFGVEKDDAQSLKAAEGLGAVVVNKYEPGYSNTIQSIYEESFSPFIIHANDDFEFHKDWDVIPLSMFERKDLMVVGLRQTESDTQGSAVSMFRRSYIDKESGVIDMPKRVFYPYKHNYVDTEFTATAQRRGVWAKCDTQVLSHHHPGFTGKEKDEVYLKNDSFFPEDTKTYESRTHLWS